LGRICYSITHHYPLYPSDNETLFPNWQKESWQTFEETSGYVRPERVNKWTNSMTYMMILRKLDVGIWNGSSWLRIETGGGYW